MGQVAHCLRMGCEDWRVKRTGLACKKVVQEQQGLAQYQSSGFLWSGWHGSCTTAQSQRGHRSCTEHTRQALCAQAY
jgi:hypothetical protein